MTDKEKIREDVSKLIIPESECNGMSLMEKGRQYAYREVLGIIDSTSEEPVSEDLESYIYKRLWRGRMGKEITKPIYFGYDELLAAAHSIADWQREQMMKDAICTEVIELCGFMRNGDEKRVIENYVPAIVILDAKHVNYPGEKVKLAFIKEG